jgi:hypothetical protein
MALSLEGSVDISGSMTATTIVVSSPGGGGMVSSSAQITELAPLMAYTASLKGAAIVSSSQQIQNYNLFARTGSANTFYGNQIISGTLSVSIGSTEAMVLTSDGYFGIGKNSKDISNGDLIGLLAFKSNDSSTNSAGAIASIRSYATADYNSGDVNGDMRFYVSQNSTPNGALLSGNEHMRLTKDGYLRLAGAGIQFNGDTAAANSLDDYEEGTWTPVPTSTGATFSTGVVGRYTKIGRLVYIYCELDNISSPTGTLTNEMTITGLPFTSINSGYGASLAVGFEVLIDYPAGGLSLQARIPGNTTQITLRFTIDNGSGDDFLASNFDASDARIALGGCYEV